MTIVLMLLTKDISRPRNSIQKQKNWRHHSTYSVIQRKVKDIWKWLCLKQKPIWKVMNYKAIFYHLWLFQVDFTQLFHHYFIVILTSGKKQIEYLLISIWILKFLFKILKFLFTDQFMILNFRWDSYEDFESNLKLLKSIPNMVRQIQNLLELGITNEITFAKGYYKL